MNLGVYLAIGESFSDYAKKGQDVLIKNYLLKNYSENFEKVFVFSYANESFKFFKNVYVVPNKFGLHRYLYSVLLPLIETGYIRQCNIFRGLQLSGGIPGLMGKLLYGKNYIINYGYEYGKVAYLEGKRWQAIVYKLIQKLIINHAKTVIVTTKYLERKLTHNYLNSKFYYIPNGVNTLVFRPRVAKKLYPVMFVGRLEKQKNLTPLIKAVSLLEKKYKKILIIGMGSEDKKILTLATDLNVEITLIPKISHDLLPSYFHRATVFVLPSLIEGQPKVLLEAMSCAVPVIASNIEAHREIISNYLNGILTAAEPESLARILSKVIKDKKLQHKLSQNARQTILTSYNQRELNQKEIELLKQ